ncbi:hypothetical protein K474DRAFT_1661486 [Panus rudis PR-1116 ss-1]|nr:hypothetical protein K474DRAFT_1661486 [Panus rudis PR-1116 ss-1]
MTLPANDALTLGLTGNHNSPRSNYPRVSLRSTSPKIPFVSPKSPAQHSAGSPRRSRQSPRRSMSGVNGIKELSDSHHDFDHLANGNGHATLAPSSKKDLHGPSRSNAAVSPPIAVPIDWEIPRKILHSSIGFVTLYLYIRHHSPRQIVTVLSSALAVIVPADLLRLNSPGFARIYERCLGFLMRESEKKTTNGVIWYILGVIFVLSVYPTDLAVLSILILSWVDTAASTIGRLWGPLTPRLPPRFLGIPLAPRKSLAGFIAGSVTGAAVIAGFWGWLAPMGEVAPTWTLANGPLSITTQEAPSLLRGWSGVGLISVVGGIFSGLAEALDLGSLDDNMTLPIISGGCIWGFLKLLVFLSS